MKSEELLRTIAKVLSFTLQIDHAEYLDLF